MYKNIQNCIFLPIVAGLGSIVQTKNAQTTCDLCGNEYNNSGYTQHRRKCEKKHAKPADEPPTADPDPEPKEEKLEEKKEKMTAAENTIHIIDHTAAEDKKNQNGFDKFFGALGDFVSGNSELFTAALATVAGAYAEKQQQQNEQNTAPKSPYGDDW